LYSDLKFAPDANNGKWTFKYENDVITTYNGRCYAIGPDLSIRPIGPERFADNNTPVHGSITAGVGTPYAAYAGLYNPDSGDSFLMKFGAYPQTQDGDPERIDAWHGSLSGVDVTGLIGGEAESWANQRISAMYRTSVGVLHPALHGEPGGVLHLRVFARLDREQARPCVLPLLAWRLPQRGEGDPRCHHDRHL
jgi:hypothetical protein